MRGAQSHTSSGAHPDLLIKALVLDDDDFDRRRFCRMSAATGLPIDVVTAGDIPQMQTHLDAAAYDIVFLDYRLGQGTGLDALGALRAHRRNAAASAVMLTGETQLDVAVAALKSGCVDYICKDGLTPELLRDVFETTLQPAPATDKALDAALYRLATDRLPHVVADVLGSPEVVTALHPVLDTALSSSLRRVLDGYGFREAMSPGEEIEALIQAIKQSDQISLPQSDPRHR